MYRLALFFTIGLAAAPACAQEPAASRDGDRTGIEWMPSFESARAEALARGRMLLLKPLGDPASDGVW